MGIKFKDNILNNIGGTIYLNDEPKPKPKKKKRRRKPSGPRPK